MATAALQMSQDRTSILAGAPDRPPPPAVASRAAAVFRAHVAGDSGQLSAHELIAALQELHLVEGGLPGSLLERLGLQDADGTPRADCTATEAQFLELVGQLLAHRAAHAPAVQQQQQQQQQARRASDTGQGGSGGGGTPVLPDLAPGSAKSGPSVSRTHTSPLPAVQQPRQQTEGAQGAPAEQVERAAPPLPAPATASPPPASPGPSKLYDPASIYLPSQPRPMANYSPLLLSHQTSTPEPRNSPAPPSAAVPSALKRSCSSGSVPDLDRSPAAACAPGQAPGSGPGGRNASPLVQQRRISQANAPLQGTPLRGGGLAGGGEGGAAGPAGPASRHGSTPRARSGALTPPLQHTVPPTRSQRQMRVSMPEMPLPLGFRSPQLQPERRPKPPAMQAFVEDSSLSFSGAAVPAVVPSANSPATSAPPLHLHAQPHLHGAPAAASPRAARGQLVPSASVGHYADPTLAHLAATVAELQKQVAEMTRGPRASNSGAPPGRAPAFVVGFSPSKRHSSETGGPGGHPYYLPGGAGGGGAWSLPAAVGLALGCVAMAARAKGRGGHRVAGLPKLLSSPQGARRRSQGGGGSRNRSPRGSYTGVPEGSAVGGAAAQPWEAAQQELQALCAKMDGRLGKMAVDQRSAMGRLAAVEKEASGLAAQTKALEDKVGLRKDAGAVAVARAAATAAAAEKAAAAAREEVQQVQARLQQLESKVPLSAQGGGGAGGGGVAAARRISQAGGGAVRLSIDGCGLSPSAAASRRTSVAGAALPGGASSGGAPPAAGADDGGDGGRAPGAPARSAEAAAVQAADAAAAAANAAAAAAMAATSSVAKQLDALVADVTSRLSQAEATATKAAAAAAAVAATSSVAKQLDALVADVTSRLSQAEATATKAAAAAAAVAAAAGAPPGISPRPATPPLTTPRNAAATSADPAAAAASAGAAAAAAAATAALAPRIAALEAAVAAKGAELEATLAQKVDEAVRQSAPPPGRTSRPGSAAAVAAAAAAVAVAEAGSKGGEARVTREHLDRLEAATRELDSRAMAAEQQLAKVQEELRRQAAELQRHLDAQDAQHQQQGAQKEQKGVRFAEVMREPELKAVEGRLNTCEQLLSALQAEVRQASNAAAEAMAAASSGLAHHCTPSAADLSPGSRAHSIAAAASPERNGEGSFTFLSAGGKPGREAAPEPHKVSAAGERVLRKATSMASSLGGGSTGTQGSRRVRIVTDSDGEEGSGMARADVSKLVASALEPVNLRLETAELAMEDLHRKVARGLTLRVTRDELRESLANLDHRIGDAVSRMSSIRSRVRASDTGTRASDTGGGEASLHGSEGGGHRRSDPGEPRAGTDWGETGVGYVDRTVHGSRHDAVPVYGAMEAVSQMQRTLHNLEQRMEQAEAAAIAHATVGAKVEAMAARMDDLRQSVTQELRGRELDAGRGEGEPAGLGGSGAGPPSPGRRSLFKRTVSKTIREDPVLTGFDEQLVLLSTRVEVNEELQREVAAEVRQLRERVEAVLPVGAA